jgi:hypothetical protein
MRWRCISPYRGAPLLMQTAVHERCRHWCGRNAAVEAPDASLHKAEAGVAVCLPGLCRYARSQNFPAGVLVWEQREHWARSSTTSCLLHSFRGRKVGRFIRDVGYLATWKWGSRWLIYWLLWTSWDIVLGRCCATYLSFSLTVLRRNSLQCAALPFCLFLPPASFTILVMFYPPTCITLSFPDCLPFCITLHIFRCIAVYHFLFYNTV